MLLTLIGSVLRVMGRRHAAMRVSFEKQSQ